ncbi:hypothetical protein DJICPGNB_17795 [Escherichia coli]|nr:hypothetical protein DJICPGNB_17795 [Escherichia coli]
MLAFSQDSIIVITNGTTVSPTSAAMSQIGQSYLPVSTGFIIGALGLIAFVGWQWRGRMRRQALGLQSPASTAVVGRQSLTAIIVLGAIWLLNDYRGVPTPVLLLTLLLLGGMFMATRTAFGRRIGATRRHLALARFPLGLTLNVPTAYVFAINGLMVAIAGLTVFLTERLSSLCGEYRRAGRNADKRLAANSVLLSKVGSVASGNGASHHESSDIA